jgi:Flp pilus assembly protein TadG
MKHRHARSDERGAAAVEMAILVSLLVALLAVVGPLIYAIQEQVYLGRAAGSAARFASATPDRKRFDCDGNAMANDRRPSAAQVEREAECVRFGSGPVSSSFSVTVTPDPSTAAPGDRITVTVSDTVDLGLLGALFGGPQGVTLSSTSIGIEE